MEANNTFSGGMNSDISKLLQGNNEYLRALNFRGLTDLGMSNGSLVNIKGNRCEITFPEVRGLYKLKIREELIDDVFQDGIVNITINGQTTSNITINTNTTSADIYAAIIALTNCYKNVNAVSPTFSSAYSTEDVVIFQNPIYTTCSPAVSVEPTITITQVSGSSGVEFIDSDGNGTSFYEAYIPSLVGNKLIVIGSTFIHETFYLLTAPITNSNEVGHIWEMSYNEITKTTTLTLIYNGYLNFTKEYPVAPSAAVGRYELDSIQRIYWTDFNNPVRSINVKDPNLMSLSTDIINLKSSVDFSAPVLSNIYDGQAVGALSSTVTYQCAYRLRKNNGAITNYSVASNLVYPIVHTENKFDGFAPSYCSIDGEASLSVNKALEWEVDGVDTDYDIIEFVVIERFAPNEDNFVIYKYEEQIINGQETIRTKFTNDEDTKQEIALAEFLIENTSFTHCKTIEQKDNRLFFGNVRNSLTDYLDTYDTRAFRFNSNTNNISVLTYESDIANDTYVINTDADWLTIPEEADLIPMYNLGLSTADDSRYNPDTKYQRNSTIIGGTGPNISYKFGSLLLRSDEKANEPTASPLGGSNNGTARDDSTSSEAYKYGFRKAGWMQATTGLNPFSNDAPFQTFRQNGIKMTMGLEYLSGTFKTGQHNEIYRYGIQFYSKTGDTNFVKWIGDIKFPNYSHPVAPGLEGVAFDGALCSDHRSMFREASSGAYCNVPYIEFTVNIPPELADLISGYEIVRVERKTEDMTIASHGLITQVGTGIGSESNNWFLPISHDSVSGGYTSMSPPTYTFSGASGPTGAYNLVAYHSYQYLCDQNSNNIADTDKLIITELYQALFAPRPIQPGGVAGSGGSFEEYYYITKFYDNPTNIFENSTYTTQRLHIDEGYYVGQDAESPNINIAGGVYKNYNYYYTGAPSYDSRAYSQGCPMVLLAIDPIAPNAPMIWENYGAVNADAKLLAIQFKPTNLSTQYGGRGYIKRANNEYISCGAYYPVRESGSTTIKTFGGDIYHGILDIQKAIKNWAGTKSSAPTKHSQTWFFPTQSIYNVDLRQGKHVNADLNNDSGTLASALDEYSHNILEPYDNNLRRFIPRPIFFNETDQWNNRIYWSETKINGEESDSWSNIPVNNYYDVEGNYGGINALVILRNNMYAVQDRALAFLLVNPTSLITDDNNVSLKLGDGSTLAKHNYVSVDAGSKHQWSVSRSSNHITFVDSRTKKIYLFDGQQLNPISDTKGNRNFVQKVLHDNLLINDNPIIANGILTTYDFKNNEFLYTFRNTFTNTDEMDPNLLSDETTIEQYTLSYSDILQRFNSFYSFTPYIYVNNHSKLYSPRQWAVNTDTKMYLHDVGNYCTFYDTIYPSSLKVNINVNPLSTKVYDNLSWITESTRDNAYSKDSINNYYSDSDDINYLNDTFKRVRCYNEYQNTDWIDLTITNPITNLRKSEQGYNVQIPRNRVNLDTTAINTKSIFDSTILTKTSFGDRLRDKYLVVDLEYDNALNNRFTVHNLKTIYRVSDR